MYVPSVVCYTELPPERLSKMYHRKWHLGHGKFNAKARRAEFELGNRRVLDVPLWLYRQTLEAGLAAPIERLKGDTSEAFERESFFLFGVGFIKERWRAKFAGGNDRAPTDRDTS